MNCTIFALSVLDLNFFQAFKLPFNIKILFYFISDLIHLLHLYLTNNQFDKMSDIQNPLITPMYKSYTKLLLICINVSLSAFFVGYSLVYMGAISINDFPFSIIEPYHFKDLNWSQNNQTYQSVIQGAIPIGAIFGALLSSQVIKFFSRRNGFLLTNILAFASIVLMVYIKNPYTFLFMRFIQGICTGIFSAIVPLYLNQFLPQDCSNLGSLNQIFIAFSQFFCFLLAFFLHLIFGDRQGEEKVSGAITTWKIISQFPLFLIIIQSLILLFVFPYETPKYLYEKGMIKQAISLIAEIYRQEHNQQALSKYRSNQKTKNSIQTSFGDLAVRSELIEAKNDKSSFQNTKIAIFFAIHLALLQQLSGVNAIAVYGKNTLQQAIGDQRIAAYVSLAIPGGSFLASILTIKVMKKLGRKKLIQIGTFVCTLCLAIVSFGFFFKQDKPYEQAKLQSVLIIIGMCVYMGFFGFTLGPIVWLYIPEIVEPNVIPYSTMTNLSGAAICIIVFPLIKEYKFIPFVFFFAWSTVSFFVNQVIMIQTKDKARETVFAEYKSLKIC